MSPELVQRAERAQFDMLDALAWGDTSLRDAFLRAGDGSAWVAFQARAGGYDPVRAVATFRGRVDAPRGVGFERDTGFTEGI